MAVRGLRQELQKTRPSKPTLQICSPQTTSQTTQLPPLSGESANSISAVSHGKGPRTASPQLRGVWQKVRLPKSSVAPSESVPYGREAVHVRDLRDEIRVTNFIIETFYYTHGLTSV
ncbi:unnamed protein product [Pieris brassicae]|uniref:Uncharacterized protein n=1 Tax=Pieris brassicae TaxID=7116 RepID=A0A9P0TMJ2_PIEBR|nr:unnamed protein product [Pieris brassicae]